MCGHRLRYVMILGTDFADYAEKIKKNTSYPIIVDPSHATGTRYMIRPLSIASVVAGADGIMVEAHIRPEKSLSDARQTINISTLKDIISDINKYQNI
mgnify:CR=1 FL=1